MAINPITPVTQLTDLPNSIVQAMQQWKNQQQTGLQNQHLGLQNQQLGMQNQILPQMQQAALNKQIGSNYTDPIMQRLYETGLAQRTGQISPDLLSKIQNPQGAPLGVNGPQNLGQQGMGGQSSMPGTTGDAFQNYLIYGTPLGLAGQLAVKAAGAGMEQQAKTGVDQWNDAQKNATETAGDANNMVNFLKGFKNSYDNSSFTGPLKGNMPTEGVGALGPVLAGHDFTNERNADTMSQNMQAQMLKLQHFNKLTNYELKFTGGLKLNRTMTPQSVQQLGDFFNAKANQLTEQQSFLNAARQKGLDVQTANTLWQKYMDQRPVYDFNSQKPNTKFQGSWQDYLQPDAVQSVKNGDNYVSIPKNLSSAKEFQNWVSALPPSDKVTVAQQLKGNQ